MLLHERLGALLASAKADARFRFASRQADLLAVEHDRAVLVAHGAWNPPDHAESLLRERDCTAGSEAARAGGQAQAYKDLPIAPGSTMAATRSCPRPMPHGRARPGLHSPA